MHVGVSRVVLHLPENHDLKGKRQVLRSIKDRVRHRFNVSIAEVEENDHWQRAVLGIACVSNEARYVNEVLSQVVEYIQQTAGDAHLMDYSIDIDQGF